MATFVTNCRQMTGVPAFLASSLLLSAAALGQDVPGTTRQGESQTYPVLSISVWGELLLDNYQLVAIGEFVDIPDEVAADLSKQAANEVVVTFEVSEAYRGFPYSEIKVRLAADMLRYPGENISRYAKGRQILLELGTRHEEVQQELTDWREAYQSGIVTAEEFRRREEELSALQERLVSDYVGIRNRQPAVIHGDSFYDLGGAIQPNEQYLVGLDPSLEDPGSFVLAESSHVQNIFWGQKRDDIVTALEQGSAEE